MMNNSINDFMGKQESEKLEFKREFNDKIKEKLLKTICAFANDYKNHDTLGVFIIGLDDNGKECQYDNIKEDEEKISNIISEGQVLPQPKISISRDIDNKIIIITVHPSKLVTWYKKDIYIRVGSSTRKANANEMINRINNAHNISFDSSECIGSDIDDIHEELFVLYEKSFFSEEIIKRNKRSLLEKLKSISFASKGGHPTYGGLLVCGENPQMYLPNAYIMFLKVDGDDLKDRSKINEKEIKGNLSSIIDSVETLIRLYIDTSMLKEGFTNKKQFTYPYEAIRELIFNAIMHRDYSIDDMIRVYWFKNEIIIKSPGGLKSPLSKENFPNPPVYRNNIIASTMKSLGKVERYGSGVNLAQSLLKENGNPPASFEFNDYFVKVSVRIKDIT